MKPHIVSKVLLVMAIAALPVLLGGCAQSRAIQGQALDVGTQAADQALELNFDVGTCRAPTVGAVMRKWGNDREKFCAIARACEWSPAILDSAGCRSAK